MKFFPGNFEKYGYTVVENGVIFTFSVNDLSCKASIVIFDVKTFSKEFEIEIKDDCRIGNLCSILLENIDLTKHCYLFKIDGEYVVDPYAKVILGRDKWNDISREKRDYQVYCGFLQSNKLEDKSVSISGTDMFIYKLHMRGFTKKHGLSAKEAGNYTGFLKLLPSIKDMGFTSIEMQPIYDFEEMMLEKKHVILPSGKTKVEKEFLDKLNFWGYGAANHFAPKASYFGKNPDVGAKEMIKTIHENDMEIIMEMSFVPTDSDDYILDVLKHWVMEYHVDGFHILGARLPIEKISAEPILAGVKLFFESIPWDVLSEQKHKHLFVYDDSFMNVMRQMQNHMNGSMRQVCNHLKRQNANFGFVNYMANTPGFTLWDSFCYGEKHNLANGENNSDGNNCAFTANYGVEGQSRNRIILANRFIQMRNAYAFTFLAQGIPLIFSGDEVCNSADGNNNPYCQDNMIGWINFTDSKAKQENKEFLEKLIDFRKNHKSIRQEAAMQMTDYMHKGYPDLSYHGHEPWMMGIGDEFKAIGLFYPGMYADEKEDVYICMNFHYEDADLALPVLEKGKRWYQVMNTIEYTNESVFEPQTIDNQERIKVPGGSITILIGVVH